MNKVEEQGEALGDAIPERLQGIVSSALRRKPSREPQLAGVLRALCPHSVKVRDGAAKALAVLTKRGSFERPLYTSSARALAEADDRRATEHLAKALGSETCGGLSTLSAACFSTDPALSQALAKVVTSRHPHLAFAAEVARVARGESEGHHIAAVAPKIKESHRISLCSELFVPLLRHRSLPIGVTPALAVLRDAERHLGRWLVLGELAVRAGDDGPVEAAADRATSGPTSARTAWSLVLWALGGNEKPPEVRPTVELVARLSDRPSADRDTTFLYRLADVGATSAQPMLESLAKGPALGDAPGIRAALYLARSYGRPQLGRQLRDLARSTRREALRGIAAAALRDSGSSDEALAIAADLSSSKQLGTMAWAGLILASGTEPQPVLDEPAYRRIQLGWVE